MDAEKRIQQQLIENEFRISVLERLLETIISNNENLIFPDQGKLEEIRIEIVEILKGKYPTCEIKYKKNHL